MRRRRRWRRRRRGLSRCMQPYAGRELVPIGIEVEVMAQAEAAGDGEGVLLRLPEGKVQEQPVLRKRRCAVRIKHGHVEPEFDGAALARKGLKEANEEEKTEESRSCHCVRDVVN